MPPESNETFLPSVADAGAGDAGRCFEGRWTELFVFFFPPGTVSPQCCMFCFNLNLREQKAVHYSVGVLGNSSASLAFVP